MSANINLSIIDQQLLGIEEQIKEQAKNELGIAGESLKSLAFVYLCVRTVLELDSDEAFECLTEGSNDLGIDAIHCSALMDREFTVTLFQGKYSRNLDGDSHFPENAIKMLTETCRYLFNPSATIQHINPRLSERIEEIRSLIRDGAMPNLRVIACNNGLKWSSAAQEAIERFGNSDQVTWEHVNHNVLVNILQRTRTVDETISLVGGAIVEDMNFSRVCIGRVSVSEIVRLMETHGDKLLERNIRSYLGLHGNRVNEGIRDTLNSSESSNFYFFNNGLTVICEKFSHNALQTKDYKVKLQNLQIVNGGQTCMTIFKTYKELREESKYLPEDAFVLIRIYELDERDKETDDIVSRITLATNNQNPVDLRDLRANDEKQKGLAMSIEKLGYFYRRKRTEATISRPPDITPGIAAVAVLSVWRQEPHRAKFYWNDHFGKLYNKIFSDSLNGSQVIIATQIYRFAENRRRSPLSSDPSFVPYASCFLAMLVGKHLLKDMGLTSVDGLDHRNFADAKSLLENKETAYFDGAIVEIKKALKGLYGDNCDKISMQQLSATFRRGDLIESLVND